MRVSSHNFATLLERRLNDIMPAPFRMRSDDGQLHLYNGGDWALSMSVASIVEDETRELTERLGTIVDSVLSSVQDSISVHLQTPWPSADGRAMAMPGVRVDADAVHLWYGRDEAAPTLSIPSIRLTEISARD